MLVTEDDSTSIGCTLVLAGGCGQVWYCMVAEHQQRRWHAMLCRGFAAILCLDLQNLLFLKRDQNAEIGDVTHS